MFFHNAFTERQKVGNQKVDNRVPKVKSVLNYLGCTRSTALQVSVNRAAARLFYICCMVQDAYMYRGYKSILGSKSAVP